MNTDHASGPFLNSRHSKKSPAERGLLVVVVDLGNRCQSIASTTRTAIIPAGTLAASRLPA